MPPGAFFIICIDNLIIQLTEKISRREFLRLSGFAIFGLMLLFFGIDRIAMAKPAQRPKPVNKDSSTTAFALFLL